MISRVASVERGERCTRCGFYNYDGREVVACPYGDRDCPMVKGRGWLPREMSLVTRVAVTALLIICLAAVLWLALLALSGQAKASECYSIRDASERQACLAQERGSPSDCLGVRDPDKRVTCRLRAGQEQRLRELERSQLR